MNDVFGPIWQSQQSASDFRLRRMTEPNTSFIHYSCLYFRTWKLKLQRNTVCFNRDINFHFFPPLRTFWWNLDVYMLDDICKYNNMWG